MLKNKCALVTGAGGGIGQAIIKQLQAAGARVAAADRPGVSVVADHSLPGDLMDEAYCGALPQAAKDALGSLDICLLYTSPSPRDATLSRMTSSA